MNDFRQDNGFTDSRAPEQTSFASYKNRAEKINGFQTCFQDLMGRKSIRELYFPGKDTSHRIAFNFPFPILRNTKYIHDSAQYRHSYRNRNRTPRTDDNRSSANCRGKRKE